MKRLILAFLMAFSMLGIASADLVESEVEKASIEQSVDCYEVQIGEDFASINLLTVNSCGVGKDLGSDNIKIELEKHSQNFLKLQSAMIEPDYGAERVMKISNGYTNSLLKPKRLKI